MDAAAATTIESTEAGTSRTALSTPRMEEDVRKLVLMPFSEAVEKGKAAIKNTRTTDGSVPDEMPAAAKYLVLQGELALTKIEPECTKLLDEYGSSFVDALKTNDQITDFRQGLNDLLWDFDIFIEPDCFDAAEFEKLRTLIRRSAPQIRDILIRMQLERPRSPTPDFAWDGSSTASPTAVGSSPRSVLSRSQRNGAEDATGEEGLATSEATARLGSLTSAQGGVVRNLSIDGIVAEKIKPGSGRQRGNSGPPTTPTMHPRSPDSVLFEIVPPEPSDDPWRRGKLPPYAVDINVAESPSTPERRPPVALNDEPGNEFLIDCSVPPLFSHASTSPTTSPTGKLDPVRQGEYSPHFPPPSSAGWSQSSVYSTTDSQHGGGGGGFRDSLVSPTTDDDQRLPAPPSTGRNSQISSTGSICQFPGDTRTGDGHHPAEPPTGPQHQPGNGILEPGLSAPAETHVPAPPSDTPLHPDPADQPGLEPVHPAMMPGLIPDDGSLPHSTVRPIPRSKCTINDDSSFKQHKGLCPGALESLRGGTGVVKTKKPSTWSETVSIARCKSCLFYFDWKVIEADINGSSSAICTSSGIRFRPRFVFKSHLPAKTADDQLYACLFCLQTGSTVEESDATVFFTQKQLFSHLARHPRPFPRVQGLVVEEHKVDNGGARDDYDLYALEPPRRSVMTGLERLLASMPAAVATETVRRRGNNSIRSPPDRPLVLEFAAGARIVGVEFPIRYKGEWAMGWADGVRGAFPADAVRLLPPDQSQICVSTVQNLRASARWRHAPKQKTLANWLKFDKGEQITGIAFTHVEHWCWSGYNSKKKWGIFPQSYIEPGTLSETPGPLREIRSGSVGDRNSVHSQEGRSGGGGGILAKITSFRHRDQGSATSSGESHTSGETAAARDLRLEIH